MAKTAYCAYCFEVLYASLGKKQASPLYEVEASWNKYASLANYIDGANSQSDEEDEVEDDEREVDGVDETKGPPPSQRLHANKPLAARKANAVLPSASLIPLSGSPHTRSTRSSTSVSSLGVEKSSNSSATGGTSNSSSHRSLFSFGRRELQDGIGADARKAEEYPLFVTWNTVHENGSKTLRGCIGTFEPQRIEDGLRSYALTSAFDDTRFDPISAKELPTLEVSVTLLTDFESVEDPFDWDIGRHGIRISFTYHRRRLGATYLPSIPREQGWNKEETIVSLMRKAGWNGRSENWRKDMHLDLVRYQGKKISMGYGTWRDWKEWKST